MARGSRLHLLLEHLPLWPAAERPRLAAELLAADDPPAGPAEAASLLAEAEAVLAVPELWEGEALAEVEITADLAGRRLIGTIDRLVISPDRVLAIDWKSNALVPERAEDVPEGLLRQMAAYAHALAQVYPGRRIETALLWTRVPRLMPLPEPLLAPALARALAELGIDPAALGP